MNAPGEVRRPGEELQPGELLRALGVGGDAVGAEGVRRGADGATRPSRGRRTVAAMAAAAAVCAGIAIGFRAGEAGRLAESSKFAANSPAATADAGFVETQGDSSVKTRKFGTVAFRGAAMAASLIGGAHAGDAVQWRVEDGGNGHWYEAGPGNLTWIQAKRHAESRGGHLATVQGMAENAFILAHLQKAIYLNAWLGGYRTNDPCDPTCTWRWVDGSPWSFTNWNFGEPNDPVNEDSLEMLVASEGRWNDLPGWASNAWPVAMIEWSADCNSDGIVDYGQIRDGTFADANTNGVPDLCECATYPELGACRCAGDVVNDGTVNGADLGTLLAYWGPITSGAFSQASDINDDGRVDGSDLGVLLSNWGACQPPAVTVPGWATLIEAIPDPAVVSDPALRTAIAATGLAWRVRDTGTGIEMLLVPPGTFQMGCVMGSNAFPCDPRELPVRQVSLTNSMYLGRYELTQGQWSAQMGSNPSYFRGFNDSSTRPVETVSWNDIQDYLTATGFRLPSEAEWEFSCRAGTLTPFYNGSSDDNTLAEIAWCSVNSGNQTHSVGSRIANALGFSDMLGNVSEWTNDWYGTYSSGAQVNPTGPATGTQRVIRGGAWTPGAAYVRSSDRDDVPAANVDVVIGFRVARDP